MLLGIPMQKSYTIGITTVYTLAARPSSGRSPFVQRPIQERVLIGLWTPATSLERGMIVLEGQDVKGVMGKNTIGQSQELLEP